MHEKIFLNALDKNVVVEIHFVQSPKYFSHTVSSLHTYHYIRSMANVPKSLVISVNVHSICLINNYKFPIYNTFLYNVKYRERNDKGNGIKLYRKFLGNHKQVFFLRLVEKWR